MASLYANSHFEGDDIKFEQVTSFDAFLDQNSGKFERIPIVFGNLEEISCYGSIDEWFDIIIQNKKLKKIISDQFSDGKLQQIAEQISNLEEFWMSYNRNSYDVIVQFFETGKKLKKVVFCRKTLDINEICERLQAKWEMSNESHRLVHIIFTKIL